MAENYNLNPNFGLNVAPKAPSRSQETTELGQKISAMFEEGHSTMNTFDRVFSGDIEKEINLYSRQAMIVGMNLRAADKTARKFDTSI